MMYLYLKKRFPSEKFYGYYNKKFLSKHNGLEIDKVFDVNLPKNTWVSDTVAFFCRVLHRLFRNLIATDNNCYMKAIYFDGYWQKNKYLEFADFIHFRDLDIGLDNERIKNEMNSCYSVSLHVRRGDYYTPQFSDIYANVCTLTYYQRSIDYIVSEHPDATFWVFSDDINWAKENLKAGNIKYVENNRQDKSYIDMFLMSNCKSNIIANSSFSFWAAMLNKCKDKIVIYPGKWKNDGYLPDVFPSDWVKIETN